MFQKAVVSIGVLIVLTSSAFALPGEWVWSTGSSQPGQFGFYGSQDLASPTNTPGARSLSTTWTDNSGDLWLFGGEDTINDQHNDLWKFDVSEEHWIWMAGGQTTNVNGSYGFMGTADPSNTPGSRAGASGWVDSAGDLWLFGGYGYGAVGGVGRLNDLWKYDVSADVWTHVGGSSGTDQAGNYGIEGDFHTANWPGGRSLSSTITSPNGNVWLFGGFTVGGVINDLWQYDVSLGQWAHMSGSFGVDQMGVYGMEDNTAIGNVPGARYSATAWVDNAGDFWIFGGQGSAESTSGHLGDLWKYDVSADQWAFMAGSKIADSAAVYGPLGAPGPSYHPGARDLHTSWKDADGNFWVFGGYGNTASTESFLNDLWLYDVATDEWAYMGGSPSTDQTGAYGSLDTSASSNQPGSRYGAVAWTDPAGDFWLFGGLGYGDLTFGKLNDLWKFDAAAVMTPPEVTAITYVSPTDVILIFSEPMSAGVTSPANYAISGAGQGTLAANPNTVTYNGTGYQLTWTSGAAAPGQLITVTVNPSVIDAQGQSMGAQNSMSVMIPASTPPACNCGP